MVVREKFKVDNEIITPKNNYKNYQQTIAYYQRKKERKKERGSLFKQKM